MPHSSSTPEQQEAPARTQLTPTMEDTTLNLGNGGLTDEDLLMADVDEVESPPVVTPAAVEPPSSAPAAKPESTEEDAPVEIKQETKAEIRLEDLFEGMDSGSDDEFSGSKTDRDVATGQVPPSSPGPVAPAGSNPDLLRVFYQLLFPWRYYFQWLNHSPQPTPDFKFREFSLWLTGGVVFRFQSYATLDLLRKDVFKHLPERIEIGPIYTANPRDRKTFRNSSAFRPIAKELCFDIDLTDYDDVRTCCDKANICIKCWQFITMAIKVLDVALREDFGYEHIMWVYSGRRGAHAWVCDRQARNLDDHKRKALGNYFSVVKGGEKTGKRVNVRRPLHPHLARSLDILKEHFLTDVLEAQDPWREEDRAEKLLQLLPDIKLRQALKEKWEFNPGRSSTAKWGDIDSVAKSIGSVNTKDLLEAKQDVVLEYTYPRLDILVTEQKTHLLKSPFVVHPGTGRVCVPIDTNDLEGFDPLDVPTIGGLVNEIDADTSGGGGMKKEGDGDEDKKGAEWERTSIKPYIDQFRGFVHGLLREEREFVRVKREREEEGGGLDF
ncbi:putative DNA primase small subunit [Triangularia setosa]|uniref:DNA primase n=1 Tax=Triangularia setosa TaxID=2587417 RepID=A0AAN6WAD5_9PEZI|nr:putative DNA primase small subunit [Podospora setosa]